MTTRRLCALLLTLLALAPTLPAARADDGTEAELRAVDALGRPGRAIKLRAKLERRGILGINPDVATEPLDFFLVAQDGKPVDPAKFVGTGETGKDGGAELDWEPPSAGQFELEVRLRRGSKYVALPAPCVVAVPPAERTVLLIHVDQTVSRATNVTMFRGTDNAKIEAVEGAPAVLRMLAAHYQLVYLTDLDASFTAKFKDWMKLRGVPSAPTVFWELFEKSLSHAAYMEQAVAKLKKDHSQLVVGVGTVDADATAFQAAGMSAILLQAEPDDDLPKTVLVATRWELVLAHVAAIHRVTGKLRELAGKDPAAADAALLELSLLGKPGLGYVHRFRADGDPNLAAAAALVTGKLEASEAFYATLERSTANQGLASLLAAWRANDRAVVARLFVDRKVGLSDPIPTFRTCELVSRNEPEPGKVVYKLRLHADDGKATEREVAFVRADDGVWSVEVKDL